LGLLFFVFHHIIFVCLFQDEDRSPCTLSSCPLSVPSSWYLFFELVTHVGKPASIAVAKSLNGFSTYQYLGIVLRWDSHLSYPHIVYDQLAFPPLLPTSSLSSIPVLSAGERLQHQYFMLPQYSGLDLLLFSTTFHSFPFGWTLEKRLLVEHSPLIGPNPTTYLFTPHRKQPQQEQPPPEYSQRQSDLRSTPASRLRGTIPTSSSSSRSSKSSSTSVTSSSPEPSATPVSLPVSIGALRATFRDSSLLFFGGHWYLFTMEKSEKHLRLYYSDTADVTSNYHLHPASPLLLASTHPATAPASQIRVFRFPPVSFQPHPTPLVTPPFVSDYSKFLEIRPAGRPFVYFDSTRKKYRLFLFLQSPRPYYGHGIDLFEITELSPTRCRFSSYSVASSDMPSQPLPLQSNFLKASDRRSQFDEFGRHHIDAQLFLVPSLHSSANTDPHKTSRLKAHQEEEEEFELRWIVSFDGLGSHSAARPSTSSSSSSSESSTFLKNSN
jgi:hypothetical protein